jgi:hypothetical protein
MGNATTPVCLPWVEKRGDPKRTLRISKTQRTTVPELAVLETNMSKCTESELRDYAANGAIRSAEVIKTDEGYVLVIELTWKEGKHMLYTFRNRPRTWANLDRLVAYLAKNALQLGSVTLHINQHPLDPEHASP